MHKKGDFMIKAISAIFAIFSFHSALSMNYNGFEDYVEKLKQERQKLEQNPSWETFYHSLEETQSDDDNDKRIRMKKATLRQLLVQASKNTTLDPQPRQEFLEKIKSGIIDIHCKGDIYMTNKDGNHRLLSYIPASKSKRFCICLINDKKLIITSKDFQTEDDIIKTEMIRLEEKAEYEAGLEVQSRYCVGIFSGNEIIIKGGNFKKNDFQHYKAIKQQFHELTQK